MSNVAFLVVLCLYVGLNVIPIIKDRSHWKYQLKSSVNSIFRLSWIVWMMSLIILSTITVKGFESWADANADIYSPPDWADSLVRLSILVTPLIIAALTVSRVLFEGLWKYTVEEKEYDKARMTRSKAKIRKFLRLSEEVK